MKNHTNYLFLLLIFFVLCSCTDYDYQNNPDEFQFFESNEGNIGPMGGQIMVTDPESELFGCGVIIDEGALSQSISIKFSIDENASIPGHPEAKVINFSPSGTTFLKPVLISLSYAHLEDEDVENLRPVYFDSETKTYSDLPIFSVLSDLQIIRAETDHFSGYANIRSGTSSSYFTDPRNEHKYEIIQIGSQTWMCENMAYLPSVNSINDHSYREERIYVYDFKGTSKSEAEATDNYAVYGALYNWEAAKVICPHGWHLSSDEDWKILEKELGMSASEADTLTWRKSGDVGLKIKATSGWDHNGNGDNSTRFQALPGGFKGKTGCFMIRRDAYFWTSSPYDDDYETSLIRSLNYFNNGIGRSFDSRDIGYSVRCVKD